MAITHGMNVDAVQSIAKGLATQAEALGTIVRTTDAAVRSIQSGWQGRDSEEFASFWNRHHRQALINLEGSIRDLATLAKDNADAQAQKSGSFPGASPAGLPQGIKDLFTDRWPKSFLENLDKLQSVLGAWGVLGANASLVGRYTDNYHDFAALLGKLSNGAISFDDLAYKGVLADHFTVGGVGDFLSKSKILDGIGKVSTVLNMYEHLSQIVHGDSPAEQWGGGVEVLADLFKTSKNPVAYLGGMAISSVDMAVQEGIKADWSEEGRLMVFDEIVKNPGVIVEEFGDAVGEVFGRKIWSIF